MVFTSHLFLFGFLPLTLLGWWALRPVRLRLAWLTLASYVFYAAWSWKFLPLMLASTCIDFLAGRMIARSTSASAKRGYLILALGINLGILALFKYAGFFADSADGLLALVGFGKPVPIVRLVLPLGISFYTFNSMSYTIDVYRGRIAPEGSLLRYCAFVALFPHLIAGPIVRYEQMARQLARLRPRLTADMASRGLFFIPLGGSRGGTLQTARNLAIVMLLGGLWHGAAATFVVWGAIHGVLLAGHAVLRARGLTSSSRALNRLVTFVCVVAAFVVFRSAGLRSAGDVLGAMVGLGGVERGSALSALLDTRFALTIGALLVFVNVVPNTWQVKFDGSFRRGLAYGLLLASAILAIAGPSPFLYYQF